MAGNTFHYLKKFYLEKFIQDLKILFRGKGDVLVNFLICGAQKCGTSALDKYLRKHPEICMGNFKEIHFFDREKYFIYNNVDYHKYHVFFNPGDNHKIIGEATPIYMYWYQAPRRIWEYNPDMKLVILLRNPMMRAYSHWNMQCEKGFESLNFSEAIRIEQERIRSNLPFQNMRFSYVDRGYYAEQIRRLLAFFPIEQLFFIRNRDLKKHPEQVLERLYNFLGVEKNIDLNPLIVHKREYPRKISAEDYQYLQRLFKPDIQQLEHITGWKLQDWLN